MKNNKKKTPPTRLFFNILTLANDNTVNFIVVALFCLFGGAL
jgi:hypothetical protein